MQISTLDDCGFSLIINKLSATAIIAARLPPGLSLKSRRELKSLYTTYTGATTNSQSSEVVIILLRQAPPEMTDVIPCPISALIIFSNH